MPGTTCNDDGQEAKPLQPAWNFNCVDDGKKMNTFCFVF